MKRKPKLIKTINDLVEAHKLGKQLAFVTSVGVTDPKPAAFYMKYPVKQLLLVIEMGLHVVKKPTK